MGTDSYLTLTRELQEATDQAVLGKGARRHACDQDFEDQVILETTRRVGLGFPLGQAVKKIYESQRLLPREAIHELHGAIVYLAAAAVHIRQEIKHEEKSCAEVPGVDSKTPSSVGEFRDQV